MTSRDRRAQLLKWAKKLFAQNGLEGTTTKAIAAKAGVTEAVIFCHFPSKEALYEAVIEQGVAASRRPEWRQRLSKSMEENDDEMFFRLLLEFIIEIHRTDPAFQRLLVLATLGGHKSALRYLHQVIDPLHDVLADYASRRQREGAFGPGDPMGIVTAVIGMGRNYAMSKYLYKVKRVDITDEEAVELFLGIAISGVRRPA